MVLPAHYFFPCFNTLTSRRLAKEKTKNMSKRTVFTTITPLPAGVTRECVIETLQNHVEMIDLNPLVIERHICPPPRDASAEEFHCTWYSLTGETLALPARYYC